MKRSYLSLSTLFFSSLLAFPVFGQDGLRTYIFGHSLINHELQRFPTPSQETSIPHWFYLLGVEGGHSYAMSGQYGFLPGHATNLPPIAQWGFDIVPAAWDSDSEPFSQAEFDNVIVAPGNFIQYQAPTLPYFGDTLTPLSATSIIFDWAVEQEDSLDLYIYESWPDMAPFLNGGFPPTPSEWREYNRYLNGEFHDWFLEYHDSLIAAYPNHCVKMIPAGPIISQLLSQPPFDQLSIDVLYEDDAPHGRATVYFLSALVSYMAMYEEPAPSNFQVPDIIDNIVADNYRVAVDYMWNELKGFNDLSGQSRVFCSNNLSAYTPNISTEHVDVVLHYNSESKLLLMHGNLDLYEIDLVDIIGRSQHLNSHARSIDMSSLADGLYLIRIQNKIDGSYSIRKVLKQE